MLTIKAESSAGTHLRDGLLPDMAALARVTNCAVEVQANDTLFIAYPSDSVGALKEAFDRLYPKSRMVMTGMTKPFLREPA